MVVTGYVSYNIPLLAHQGSPTPALGLVPLWREVGVTENLMELTSHLTVSGRSAYVSYLSRHSLSEDGALTRGGD